MTTSQSDDGIGPTDCPEHPGLFQTGANYGLAARFDNARADEELLLAEFGVTHARGVSLEVIGFDGAVKTTFLLCSKRHYHFAVTWPLTYQYRRRILLPATIIAGSPRYAPSRYRAPLPIAHSILLSPAHRVSASIDILLP